MLRTLQVGNNFFAYAFLILGMAAFHFSTLEEYYIGSLILPPCNAVGDGSVLIIILFIITGCTGNMLWAKPVCNGEWLGVDGITELTIGQIIVIIAFVLSIFVVISK